jgi:hypothetical protein
MGVSAAGWLWPANLNDPIGTRGVRVVTELHCCEVEEELSEPAFRNDGVTMS